MTSPRTSVRLHILAHFAERIRAAIEQAPSVRVTVDMRGSKAIGGGCVPATPTPHPAARSGEVATTAMFQGHPGYETIQQIHGVGPVFAAIFVAEIGDVTRFDNARQISSWAGMTPRHRESDTVTHRGAITKQGPRLVR